MFEFRSLCCAHAKLHALFPFDGLLEERMYHVPIGWETGSYYMYKYSRVVMRTMEWTTAGQAGPAPNNHGDTNIHYKLACTCC